MPLAFWILMILIVVNTVISVINLSGHGAWMVVGYNSLSKEEKEKFDKKKVAKNDGIIGLLQNTCFVVFAIMLYSQSEFALKYAPWVIVIITVIGLTSSAWNRLKYRSKKRT